MCAAALDFRNANSLWCSVLVETLARLGLRHAVISPGSRSAPLTFAFARHPGIEAVPVLDERSAGFFALGLARQHHRPTALVCTSGTAAANFLPAVIEAHESGVPLLVLTADRPPELRACAAGQAIDQQKLYGSYVRHYQELAVPEADRDLLRHVRQAVVHAFERARAPEPGPVHLNAPFRDPLPPLDDGHTGALEAGFDEEAFFAQVGGTAGGPGDEGTTGTCRPGRRPGGSEDAFSEWARISRGLIVAGPAQPDDPAAYSAAVARLADALGWPVLADGLSPVRNDAARHQALVTNYSAILRSPAVADRLAPDGVLCLGEWPTSKQLRQWLQARDARTWLVSPGAQNRDALHGRTRHLRCEVGDLAAALPGARRDPGAHARDWLRADAAAQQALDARLSSLDFLFEGEASRTLAQTLPAGTPVFVANSMPVRDVEFFWGPNDRLSRLYFNRGANGIDGTLSTALGVAHGNRPAVLLCGDLALLHDANGFLIRPKLRGSLTVVLINNRGGGIFEMLPVAKFDPPFEEFFATPQSVDFAALAAAHGATHVLVRDRDHLEELVSALPESGLRVLEVRTDRKRDAALRRELAGAESAAAASALSA